jgi:undecaprenyl-diphosphatase
MASVTHTPVVSRPRTRRGLVLCDHASPYAELLAELRARFSDHDIEPCAATEVPGYLREARLAARPFVAIAAPGLRHAADALAHCETALLPLPSGTPDNFAAALGIETLDDAVKAAEGRNVELVDVGRVNGRAFLHAASVGGFPGVAESRAALRELRRARIVVPLDGRPVVAWLVLVGNGCFGTHVGDLTSRESLDENVLDFRIVRADQRLALTRLVVHAARDHHIAATAFDRRTARSMSIAVRGHHVIDVTLDGSRVRLDTPLRFASDAGALRVLVPS